MTGGFSVGGTVTYEYFTGSTCSGTPTTVGSPVAVTAGLVPKSVSQKLNSGGSFSWEAVYSGDSNNMGATAPCEPLTVNSPPTLSIPSAQTVIAGSTIRFTVNATDGSKTVTLTASGLPAGATFSSTRSFAGGASSIFSWTPSDSQAAGDYNVTFTAQDTQGISTVLQLTIHVYPLNRAPSLPILSYSVFGIVGFLAVVVVAVLLRRVQTSRKNT
jgi:hypothetical protein